MDNSLKITALQPEVLVKLLKQAGSRTASPEMIAEDLASGAPQNPDGTINLWRRRKMMSCKNTLLADMSTAKPHGISESRGPRKVPEAAKRTRGPWPKGGNFGGIL